MGSGVAVHNDGAPHVSAGCLQEGIPQQRWHSPSTNA